MERVWKRAHNGEVLTHASTNGNLDIVKRLLAIEGVDVNATDTCGWTALMRACRDGHLEVVKIVLTVKGIDVNAKSNNGWTVLIYASFKGNLELVKCLLAVEGIDVNAKSIYGRTALIWASYGGHLEIVKRLLAVEGIEVNTKSTCEGWTALIDASNQGYLEIAKCLIRHFATVDTDELSAVDTSCAKDICLNWKQYLPQWSYRNHVFFPSGLRRTIVTCCCVFERIGVKGRIPKDIKRLLITHIVEGWKNERSSC